jgi:hypothetical protein
MGGGKRAKIKGPEEGVGGTCTAVKAPHLVSSKSFY